MTSGCIRIWSITLQYSESSPTLEMASIGCGARQPVGEVRFSTICRELNFASEWINDVPDRDALQRLLARVEADSKRRNGYGRSASLRGISDARGRLLQAARQLADKPAGGSRTSLPKRRMGSLQGHQRRRCAKSRRDRANSRSTNVNVTARRSSHLRGLRRFVVVSYGLDDHPIDFYRYGAHEQLH
jgi:hypothetical protein